MPKLENFYRLLGVDMWNAIKNMDTFYVLAIPMFLLLSVMLCYQVAFGASNVTLSNKKWVCTASRPVGITAECTVYELKDRGFK